MKTEVLIVKNSLKKRFNSASNIYVDTDYKECEVTVSIDEYQGELYGYIIESGIKLQMIDYSDVYPYKYVFNYVVKNRHKPHNNIIPINAKGPVLVK
jgi:hypothetical protein